MPNLDKLRIDSKNDLERARASEESAIHSQAAMSAVIQNEASTRAIESRSASLREKGNVLHKEQEVLNQSIEEEQIEATLHPQRLQEVKESAELNQMLFEQVQSILGSFSEIENKRLNQSSLMIETISSEAIKYTEEAKNAIKQSSIESLVKILDKISDINYQDSDGRTLLMHVLSNGFFPAVDILLSNPDIDIDILDHTGRNALIYACAMPHMDYVKKILDRTKDINIKIPGTGDTPLHLVISANCNLFSDELVKNHNLFKGVHMVDGSLCLDLSSPIQQEKALLIVDQFLQKGVNLDTENNIGYTPFSIACCRNFKYIVNNWLDKGLININYQNNSGDNVLGLMSLYKSNYEVFDLLLNKGADPNIPNKQGFYPMHIAAEKGVLDKVKLLSNYCNVDILSQVNIKTTALYFAAQNGHTEIVEWLASKGANIDVKGSNGMTAFFVSVLKGRIEAALALQKHGAKTNITDSDGSLPVHVAAQSGNVDMLKLMPSNNVNITTDNQYKLTPLWLACLNGHLDAVKFLLENGADPNLSRLDNGVSPVCIAMSEKHINIVKQLLGKDSIDLTSVDKTGTSIIHLASALGDAEILQNLIGNNLDINIADNQGFYPIHAATHHGHTEIIDILLANGANINTRSENTCWTPLYYAISSGLPENLTLIDYLLAKGADPMIANSSGYYPMYGAIHYDQLDTVKTLLKHDKSIVNQLAKDNITPLYYSLRIQHGGKETNITMVKLLLENGADPFIAMNDGDTPIHMAHYAASKEGIKVLLDHGVSLNVQNQELKTPLHCLIASDTLSIESKKEIIKLFRDKYDLSLQDNAGKTVTDYAKEYCPDTLEYLSVDAFIKDSASTNTSVHSSIFDDSQSLIASHATSETEVMGDQDSYSGI